MMFWKYSQIRTYFWVLTLFPHGTFARWHLTTCIFEWHSVRQPVSWVTYSSHRTVIASYIFIHIYHTNPLSIHTKHPFISSPPNFHFIRYKHTINKQNTGTDSYSTLRFRVSRSLYPIIINTWTKSFRFCLENSEPLENSKMRRDQWYVLFYSRWSKVK